MPNLKLGLCGTWQESGNGELLGVHMHFFGGRKFGQGPDKYSRWLNVILKQMGHGSTFLWTFGARAEEKRSLDDRAIVIGKSQIAK